MLSVFLGHPVYQLCTLLNTQLANKSFNVMYSTESSLVI